MFRESISYHNPTPHKVGISSYGPISSIDDSLPSHSQRAHPEKIKLSLIEKWCQKILEIPEEKRNTYALLYFGALLLLPLLLRLLLWNHLEAFLLSTIFTVCLAGISFSLYLLLHILNKSPGPPEIQEIATPIRLGSQGFFSTQYTSILKISSLFSLLLFLLYLLRPSTPHDPLSPSSLALLTTFTFALGALSSALAGYSGLWVSIRANSRTANAARSCINQALQICFYGGAFSSVLNVSLALLGISLLYSLTRLLLPSYPPTKTPLLLVGFTFGSSLVAMFAQLGGGIYTKGADVGADLVGKVEVGLPEDDVRNPAVIADLVGDNVGDCAGQCSDLFESISAEIISVMILGGSVMEKRPEASPIPILLFPLLVHCIDIIVSSICILLVQVEKGMPSLGVDGKPQFPSLTDPLTVMVRTYALTCVCSGLLFSLLSYWCFSSSYAPTAWSSFALCGCLGMVGAFLFVLITQYYTDYKYGGVRELAASCVSGPATNVISGLALGMESCFLPIVLICVCVYGSFALGRDAGLLGEKGGMLEGLYGIGICTMGFLCTCVFVLTMSSFGPIADNAGGIVEMSMQPSSVRFVTDKLDMIGNVTKANTKGFSVGSAALACFLLFVSFLDDVQLYSGVQNIQINFNQPEMFISGLFGGAVVFLFSSMAMKAVGKTSQEVVKEVRRQFREMPGIMDYHEKPDYQRCVSIVSQAALREMLLPGLLSVLSPALIGFLFKYIGDKQGNYILGAQCIAAFLIGSTMIGILMALFLNNAGGAWDNAKKYIETGEHGGKGSDAHKAAVVGDTVGDPCKDTAGPSLHVLIKLASTTAMILVPLIVQRRN